MLLPADAQVGPRKALPNVITSFTEEGYRKYGEKFIETFLHYWPPSIRLTVYYEGEDFPFTPGLSWRPIEEVEFLEDYLNAIRPFPIMHGIVGNMYDINYDARMARKAFMQVHAARKYGGKVFWIDADSVTYKAVPEKFLDECLPDDKFSCFLGRDGWYFTESGFIGFNANHPIARDFFKNYVHLFITGVIFTQQWWHDCIGYDCTRLLATKQGMGGEFVNLAEGLPHGTMHPLQNCAPGRYLMHFKGDRKETGELKPGDVIAA
jgi:hypothetical protein